MTDKIKKRFGRFEVVKFKEKYRGKYLCFRMDWDYYTEKDIKNLEKALKFLKKRKVKR